MKNNAPFFTSNPSKSGCVIKTPAYMDPPNFYNPSIDDEPGRMNPPPKWRIYFSSESTGVWVKVVSDPKSRHGKIIAHGIQRDYFFKPLSDLHGRFHIRLFSVCKAHANSDSMHVRVHWNDEFGLKRSIPHPPGSTSSFLTIHRKKRFNRLRALFRC